MARFCHEGEKPKNLPFFVLATCDIIVPAMSQINKPPAPKRGTKKEKNWKK